MDEVVAVQNVDNVCRLCLSPDEPKLSIFNAEGSFVPLAFKIQACLSIEISSNDRLSTLICQVCVKNVNQWHNYKESCLQAQDTLQRWLANQLPTPAQLGVSIKQEPIDLEYQDGDNGVIAETNDEPEENQPDLPLCISNLQTVGNNESADETTGNDDPARRRTRSTTGPTSPPTLSREPERNMVPAKPFCMVQVKTEPMSSCNIEIQSVTGSVLLPNPVALNNTTEDRVMEADSTQKPAPASKLKKKIRRGPHTHLRMKRTFKQKCMFCMINLHSKFSYLKHMQRFHSPNSEEMEKPEMKPNPVVPKKPRQRARKSLNPLKLSSMVPEVETPPQEAEEKPSEIVVEENSLEEEMVEDVEEEIDDMDNDAPLSQVQQDIIGQLKTFSCYPCQQTFHDRRSTLNHLRQHMPDLRPFTCVACLTEFPDRSAYKSHCGSSFECAMKIALVEPKFGMERYFTCNMCLRPLASRKELLSHLSKHSDKQYAMLTSPTRSPPKLSPIQPLATTKPLPDMRPISSMKPLPAMKPLSSVKSELQSKRTENPTILGPYQDGNPAFNHICDLCGMIYRYKPNMFKHRELCSKLPPDVRTSYTCTHCRMTFLVFKKFHSHIYLEHKKKELTCGKCYAKFKSASDYLTHHESQHRNNAMVEKKPEVNVKVTSGFQSPLKEWNDFEAEVNANQSRISKQRYSCALCGQEFPTRAELSEHRNLHLKVKIYSCVICRSMFSSAGALEVHMKDHGIEDPKEQSANSSCVEYEGTDDTQESNPTDLSEFGENEVECTICKKMFSSSANAKRHMRNIHSNNKKRYKCMECDKSFKEKSLYEHHAKTEHNPAKPTIRCPKCPKTFVVQANLNLHMQNVHGETSQVNLQCTICGKAFLEEYSLRIHKGWHARSNCRLTTDRPENQKRLTKSESFAAAPKPARARKSFPNAAPAKPVPKLQCQVCDQKFSEVTELRKHLWEVHCARNKTEKDPTSEGVQCVECNDIFPDEASLERHREWHRENAMTMNVPLKKQQKLERSEQRTHPCDVCGNYYSTPQSLAKHKRLHKVSTVASIKFQSIAKKPLASQFQCSVCRRVFDTLSTLRRHKERHFVNPTERKRRSVLEKSDFMCEPCLKYYATGTALRHHQKRNCPFNRQLNVEGPTAKRPKLEVNTESEDSTQTLSSQEPQPLKPVKCSTCKKTFEGMSMLYRHRQQMHSAGQPQLSVPKKRPAPKIEPAAADSEKVSCDKCGKQFPGPKNLKSHIVSAHKFEKPSNCKVCKNSFASPTALRNHMQCHSSVMFQCNLCERHFLARAAMTRHMLKLHKSVYQSTGDRGILFSEINLNSSVEKKVIGTNCPHCELQFLDSRSLKIHIFRRHQVPK